MAVNTELRNAIYERFIDLAPTTEDVANLVLVNQQIHAEFGTLYLRSGNVKVPLNCIDHFLNVFFLHYPESALQNAPCGFRVSIDLFEYQDWSVDLLNVVVCMNRYPLLDIKWNKDIAEIIHTLKSLDAPNLARMAFVTLKLYKLTRNFLSVLMPRMGARLLIIVKSEVTEDQIDELGFHAEYGNAKVKIIWEDESDSDDREAEIEKKDAENYEDLWAGDEDGADWDEDDVESDD
ncbi:hypothetical protein J4E86_011134 [Alternaria arbusti]|uniref:uncharacterized protein n=1 Tax=Alternaria arbusti TaxID=232088 RepID=UPI00221FC91E|nr:uncharacterized protein J4E86_011134 [Alternaria arbusti]KAI4940168.1 hypothetical protein J4E86_011134 [Alternaria arbusti]